MNLYGCVDGSYDSLCKPEVYSDAYGNLQQYRMLSAKRQSGQLRRSRATLERCRLRGESVAKLEVRLGERPYSAAPWRPL
jgi:hypothetical protein